MKISVDIDSNNVIIIITKQEKNNQMNLIDAINSKKPFRHKHMIGAFCYMTNDADPCYLNWICHRDNISDFRDMNWIDENCVCNDDGSTFMMENINLDDLLRTDWYVIEDVNDISAYHSNYGYDS